jgi:hypothetical protein
MSDSEEMIPREDWNEYQLEAVRRFELQNDIPEGEIKSASFFWNMQEETLRIEQYVRS